MEQTGQTRLDRGGLTESICSITLKFTQRVRRDFSSCLLTRKVLRTNVARTVLSPARKFGGSYFCTMRAASEVFAADATREIFEYDFASNFAYDLSRVFCRLILYHYCIGCATALPMGVAPEIVLYCLQWRIISNLFIPCSLSRRNFKYAPDGSNVP